MRNFLDRARAEGKGQDRMSEFIKREGSKAESITANPYSVRLCPRSYCLWAAGFNDKQRGIK